MKQIAGLVGIYFVTESRTAFLNVRRCLLKANSSAAAAFFKLFA